MQFVVLSNVAVEEGNRVQNFLFYVNKLSQKCLGLHSQKEFVAGEPIPDLRDVIILFY